MSTNFYRIPKSHELMARKTKLLKRIEQLDVVDVSAVENEFRTIELGDWETINPWEEFTNGISIHLGKRSSGWKFCWNFHNNKYYSNKQELIDFIKKGRIVDEYGNGWTHDAFIEMAMSWGQPDGWIFNRQYEEARAKENPHYWRHGFEHYDREVDGLRVSSATEFF